MEMSCQSCLALVSTFNSLLSSELCVFFKTSCAGAEWWMTCWDLDYWDGQNQGRACHFGAIFGQTAGDSQRDSLVWSGLTVCSPTMAALPDNSAWRTQMSVHRRTDTRLGFAAQRWAHVPSRYTEDDAAWHLTGNQWTQTEERLRWHLLSVYGQKQEPKDEMGLEFRKHHKNRMTSCIKQFGINSKVIQPH